MPNKKIKSLTSFAGTHTCGAASPLCPTCLRPLFKSYVFLGLTVLDSLHQIKNILENNNYFGVMNNCKWMATYNLFQDEELPFLYRSKTIDGEVFPEDHLRFDVREVFPRHLESLLWLEIHSIEKIEIGELIKPETIDHTYLAIQLAEKAKARFTTTEYGLKIWGYVEQNQNIEFYKSKT